MSGDPTYHGSVAAQHYYAKLDGAYQIKTLLAHMWACVNDPWADEPKIFLASSRLECIIESRTGRSAAIAKLVKIGAVKKSKATRAGCMYTLQRPPLWALSEQLRRELENISPNDYRFDPRTPVDTATVKSKVKRLPGLARVERKVLTANNHDLGVRWSGLAKLLETVCDLKPKTIRYARGSKDVEAMATWLLANKIKPSEIKQVCRLVKRSAAAPTGYALRYVFEANTPDKLACLHDVLAKLRPVVQAVGEAQS